MSGFDVLNLFGGLAMFLFGMRLMGDGLKEGSSGTLKTAMEHVTNNAFKAFLLGVLVTAIIQSSTATIVITSGLVAAGIITLRQSLGIIIGANVGTTVTGQIIRLLDLDTSGASWLQIFKPSTLAPAALIIGIILIMGFKKKGSNTAGKVAIGFGILFSGLLSMTNSVTTLAASGVFEKLFSNLGSNPLIGYLTGAGVAFALQSSSATIGILQAFSQSGALTFKAIYAVIVGIYLGDCVTTAIVCSIGARADAKRVGAVNILFNLSETVLVLIGVTIAHKAGLLDAIWDKPIFSGGIANTNTIFNLSCALLLFPMLPVYEKLSMKIVKDEKGTQGKYTEIMDGLSPAFFNSPALALRGCYDALAAMFDAAKKNIYTSFELLDQYDPKKAQEVIQEEENIDLLTDRVSKYLVALSPNIRIGYQVQILDQYYKIVTEFERLGDHAINICETAEKMDSKGLSFSETAKKELKVLEELIKRILDYSEVAFKKRDAESAYHIEPLEEVVDDLVNSMKEKHIARLRGGKCNIEADSHFLNMLTDIERISDICSNIGVSTVARVYPERAAQAHDYISSLHSGNNETFNAEYNSAHEEFFGKLPTEEARQTPAEAVPAGEFAEAIGIKK